MNLINLAVAFGAGVISITSPCCLPLLPGYLGYLTGLSASDLEAKRGRTIAAALLFVAGFSLVFIALGASASVLGSLLLTYRLPAARIAGVFVLMLGLVLLLEGRISILSRGGDWSRWSAGGRLWTAPVLGAANGRAPRHRSMAAAHLTRPCLVRTGALAAGLTILSSDGTSGA